MKYLTSGMAFLFAIPIFLFFVPVVPFAAPICGIYLRKESKQKGQSPGDVIGEVVFGGFGFAIGGLGVLAFRIPRLVLRLCTHKRGKVSVSENDKPVVAEEKIWSGDDFFSQRRDFLSLPKEDWAQMDDHRLSICASRAVEREIDYWFNITGQNGLRQALNALPNGALPDAIEKSLRLIGADRGALVHAIDGEIENRDAFLEALSVASRYFLDRTGKLEAEYKSANALLQSSRAELENLDDFALAAKVCAAIEKWLIVRFFLPYKNLGPLIGHFKSAPGWCGQYESDFNKLVENMEYLSDERGRLVHDKTGTVHGLSDREQFIDRALAVSRYWNTRGIESLDLRESDTTTTWSFLRAEIWPGSGVDIWLVIVFVISSLVASSIWSGVLEEAKNQRNQSLLADASTSGAVLDDLSAAVGAYNKRELHKALKLALPLANKGNSKAQYLVGKIYGEGLPGSRPNTESELHWLLEAAKHGETKAAADLSNHWKLRDAERWKWLLAGAERGDALLQRRVAACYFAGCEYRIARNRFEATRWLRKSAEGGNADSQYDLGIAYEKGVGIEANDDKAVEWFRRAARLGNYDAQVAIKSRGLSY